MTASRKAKFRAIADGATLTRLATAPLVLVIAALFFGYFQTGLMV